jgi:uncharacterized protein (TIGR00251 family)
MSFVLQVKITPNAAKNQIIGFEEGILRIRIRGVPEKGKVNRELIAFLADVLGITKSSIQIVSGHTARIKRLEIAGLKEWPKSLLNG